MNYIEQIKGFWACHESHQFGTNEIAMYFHLLEIWNKVNWAPSFRRNNYKIKADLSIKSHKTLDATRTRLQECGVLNFMQSNGNPNALYMMHDLSKKYLGKAKTHTGNTADLGKNYQAEQGNEAQLFEELGTNLHPNLSPNLSKNYQGLGVVNINQTKPNQTSEDKSSDTAEKIDYCLDNQPKTEKIDPLSPNTSGAGKEEKKKSCAKKRKEEKKAHHWVAMSKCWFDLHLELRKRPCPRFTATDGAKMRSILLGLQDIAETQSYEWTETNAVAAFTDFLRAAHQDNWLAKNWLLKNLDQNFNVIIDKLQNPAAAPGQRPNVLQKNFDAVMASKEFLKKQREQKNSQDEPTINHS